MTCTNIQKKNIIYFGYIWEYKTTTGMKMRGKQLCWWGTACRVTNWLFSLRGGMSPPNRWFISAFEWNLIFFYCQHEIATENSQILMKTRKSFLTSRLINTLKRCCDLYKSDLGHLPMTVGWYKLSPIHRSRMRLLK